jgi:hypothetical protein
MTRLEKIQMAIEKGITCDVNTGKVYGVRGKEIISKQGLGYKVLNFVENNKMYHLLQHQFIYYVATGKIVEQIDHINGDKTDNRITNLREVTNQQNQFNRKTAKGFTKNGNGFAARVHINGETIRLGTFETQTEAHQAYIDAKKIYHII